MKFYAEQYLTAHMVHDASHFRDYFPHLMRRMLYKLVDAGAQELRHVEWSCTPVKLVMPPLGPMYTEIPAWLLEQEPADGYIVRARLEQNVEAKLRSALENVLTYAKLLDSEGGNNVVQKAVARDLRWFVRRATR